MYFGCEDVRFLEFVVWLFAVNEKNGATVSCQNERRTPRSEIIIFYPLLGNFPQVSQKLTKRVFDGFIFPCSLGNLLSFA